MALALRPRSETQIRVRGYQHWCLMKSMLAPAGRRPQVERRLKGLARRNQVICVTHLAQIAVFADHHYAVSKRERKGRVMTVIEELGRDERAREGAASGTD